MLSCFADIIYTMTIMNVPFIDLTQIRDQIKEDTVESGASCSKPV